MQFTVLLLSALVVSSPILAAPFGNQDITLSTLAHLHPRGDLPEPANINKELEIARYAAVWSDHLKHISSAQKNRSVGKDLEKLVEWGTEVLVKNLKSQPIASFRPKAAQPPTNAAQTSADTAPITTEVEEQIVCTMLFSLGWGGMLSNWKTSGSTLLIASMALAKGMTHPQRNYEMKKWVEFAEPVEIKIADIKSIKPLLKDWIRKDNPLRDVGFIDLRSQFQAGIVADSIANYLMMRMSYLPPVDPQATRAVFRLFIRDILGAVRNLMSRGDEIKEMEYLLDVARTAAHHISSQRGINSRSRSYFEQLWIKTFMRSCHRCEFPATTWVNIWISVIKTDEAEQQRLKSDFTGELEKGKIDLPDNLRNWWNSFTHRY